MQNRLMYDQMIRQFEAAFVDRLKTAILFGTRTKGKTAAYKDHDIFLVIEDLSTDPLKRQKEWEMTWEEFRELE